MTPASIKENDKKQRELLLVRIGKRITFLREQAGMTQEELADKMGVSVPTICTWENGKRELKATLLVQLAQILKTTPNYLTEFEGIQLPEYITEPEFEVFLALRKDKWLLKDLAKNPEKIDLLHHVWKSVREIQKETSED